MHYFNYEVLYVMNITDIDDKIIRRARSNHLYTQYLKQDRSRQELISDLSDAIKVSFV